ncbi:hypothetical protein OH764_00780 [Burkholderia sp. M6-3]
MPADKLGRYMTSRAFLERAQAAVAKAVRALGAKGIPEEENMTELDAYLATVANGTRKELTFFLGMVCKSPGVEVWLSYPGRTGIKGVPR